MNKTRRKTSAITTPMMKARANTVVGGMDGLIIEENNDLFIPTTPVTIPIGSKLPMNSY
jgi:hypothetical protein